jgi:hypothetical protein
MIVAFPSRIPLPVSDIAPERRRVVILGAGAAGLTAALHIGEHSVLLEQRARVGAQQGADDGRGGDDDRKNSIPMGAAGARHAGAEDLGADRQRQGVSAWERQALARAGSSGHVEADRAIVENGETVVVARWIPPRLDPADDASGDDNPRESLNSLVPLLRGDLRLATRVTGIFPATHSIELADGGKIVYDKLVSSLHTGDLLGLLTPQLPDRIRSHQALMYWLAARDIELLDESTQFLLGDSSAFAAGRRVAESVNRALSQKFRPLTQLFPRGERLFKPRLVRTAIH